MADLPKFLVDQLEAMTPEVRREFINHTIKHTPPTKVQLELRKHGLTVNELRKLLKQKYPSKGS